MIETDPTITGDIKTKRAKTYTKMTITTITPNTKTIPGNTISTTATKIIATIITNGKMTCTNHKYIQTMMNCRATWTSTSKPTVGIH